MGRKSKKIALTDSERIALEKGYKSSKSKTFSQRCHMILLKSQGRTSQEIADIFGITFQPVNSWVKRYLESGIEGLKTRPGQGRKPILDKVQDGEKVKAAIKKERQRIKLAKEDLENDLGKKFSVLTLKRFLKNLGADTNESV
ncbi:MAG: helix-turn-helix domain containing protein [Flavobacteriales bacterium]|nr:helix-turn-helix domain containing protein [Flavobacteriales bacterium]